MNKANSAWRLIEAVRSMAGKLDKAQGTYQFSNRAEEVQLYAGDQLSDDFDEDVVAVGNWNTLDTYNRETQKLEDLPGGDLLERLGNALERIGVELVWSDCTTTCDECNKLFNTHPTCYGWQPSYVMGDGYLTCKDCLDPEAYLQELEGNPDKALNLDAIDPADHGYKLLQEGFEAGWHPGQDASRKKIAEALRKRGVERFLFRIDDVGQFDAKFSVWVHEDEEAPEEELHASEVMGPSYSEAIKRGLQAASRVADSLQGEGVKYVSIDGEGNASGRVISRQEFAEKGIKP